MFCIYCAKATEVTNSRSSKKNSGVWRRRECQNCKKIFSSRERPDFSLSIMVRKVSGDLEPFSEDKLFISVNDSLSHRKTSLSHSRQLADTILAHLIPNSDGQLTHQEIISAAYNVIRRFDRPAATYYKSHHPLK